MNRQFRNRALSGMMAALMVFSAVGTSVMDVYASAQDVPAASAEAESTVSTAEDGIQVQIDENGTVIEETANVQNETEVQAEAASEEGAAEAVPEAADEAYSAASYAEETDTGDSASEVTDDKAKAADKAKDASKDAEEDVVEEAVDETDPNTLSESHKAFIRLLGGAIGIDPEYYIASAEQSRDFPLVGAIDSDGWRFVADASNPVTIYLTEDESDVRYYNTSGDFGTYYRSVQLGDYHGSGNAICVMPSLGSNGPGYYNAYPITNSAMRKLMYYAPGCYGYEHSYDAQVAYVVVGEGNQYVYWHLVASYALELIANGGDASQTTDWAKELADFQYDVVLQICSQILGLPDPPEDFDAVKAVILFSSALCQYFRKTNMSISAPVSVIQIILLLINHNKAEFSGRKIFPDQQLIIQNNAAANPGSDYHDRAVFTAFQTAFPVLRKCCSFPIIFN